MEVIKTPDPIADARAAGIDIDLLDTLLAQSVAVRWRQHEAALALVLQLEKGKRDSDARIHDATQTPSDADLRSLRAY